MADVVTRMFRHLRKEKNGGKRIVLSSTERNRIQKASRRRIVADGWMVLSTVYWARVTIYRYEYLKNEYGSWVAYPGDVLEDFDAGRKEYEGIAYQTTYKLSAEYRSAEAEAVRRSASYGDVFIDGEYIGSMAGRTVAILSETVYDKGKPVHWHIENKDDWHFKNDVETDFDR